MSKVPTAFECVKECPVRAAMESELADLRQKVKFPPPKGTVYGDPETIKELSRDAERYRLLRRNGFAIYRPMEMVVKLRGDAADFATDALAEKEGVANDPKRV